MVYPIDSDFFKAVKVCSVSPRARLFYIGLNSLADDDGLVWYGAINLKIILFPEENRNYHKMVMWANELIEAKLIMELPNGKGKTIKVLDWND